MVTSGRTTPTTMRDVARAAKVDVAVVSKVLRNDPGLSVREETRQRVLTAVDELGYRLNTAARTLRTARAGAYGLIVPDFSNAVYAQIIEGAQDAALDVGCVLLSASPGSRSGHGLRRFADILGNGAIDGLLIAGAAEPEELARVVSQHGSPVLFVNRRGRGERRSVVLNDQEAAQVAVQHLLELGHIKVAHIAGASGSDTAQRRSRGFRSALARAGLAVPSEWVVRGDYSLEGGYAAMTKLLSAASRPTAVVVANVASAFGALSAARDVGLRVPQDVSVVSIHDDTSAEYAFPRLTAVKMPLHELGSRAVHVLRTRAATDDIDEVVDEPPVLVVRDSTCSPKAITP